MSDTPNFDYDLPTVDGDEGIWGTKLNNIITQIDLDLYQTLGNPASWANMEKNGADKTGVDNIYDSLILAQLASDIIYFGKGTYNLATNITLSANKLLVFEKGAVLSVADGVTLTANNTLIQAGLWQIFNLNTSGILAGTWKIMEWVPEWFGATGDNSTNDYTALHNTFLSIPENGFIVFSNGIYKFTSSIDMNDYNDNLTMKFINGSRLNGVANTITGDNTKIEAGLSRIFQGTETFVASWNLMEVFPEWFGAVGDAATDDYVALTKAIEISLTNSIKLSKVYAIGTTLTWTAKRITFQGSTFLSRGRNDSGFKWIGVDQGKMFEFGGGSSTMGTSFKSISFSDKYLATERCILFDLDGSFNTLWQNCNFGYSYSEYQIILFGSGFWNKIEGCFFETSGVYVTTDQNAFHFTNNTCFGVNGISSYTLRILGNINATRILENVFEGYYSTAALDLQAANGLLCKNNRVEVNSGESIKIGSLVNSSVQDNFCNKNPLINSSAFTSYHEVGQNFNLKNSQLDTSVDNIEYTNAKYPNNDILKANWNRWSYGNCSLSIIEDGSILRTSVSKFHTPTGSTYNIMRMFDDSTPELELAKQNYDFFTFSCLVKAPSANTGNPVIIVETKAAYSPEYISIPKDDDWHWIKYSRRLDPTDTYIYPETILNYGGTINAADVLYVAGVEFFIGCGASGIPVYNKRLAAPIANSWQVGEYIENYLPAELGGAGSKYIIKGWICTVAGTPGTWLECRVLTGN